MTSVVGASAAAAVVEVAAFDLVPVVVLAAAVLLGIDSLEDHREDSNPVGLPASAPAVGLPAVADRIDSASAVSDVGIQEVLLVDTGWVVRHTGEGMVGRLSGLAGCNPVDIHRNFGEDNFSVVDQVSAD